MLSLPWTYAVRASRRINRRFRLVSAFEAYELAKALYGDAPTGPAASPAASSNRFEWDRRIRRERTWARMVKSLEDPFRGLASNSFPALDAGSMLAQSGISCRGCDEAYRANSRLKPKGADTSDLLTQRDRAFSQAEFEQHLKECEGVKRFHTMNLCGEKKWASPFRD